VEAVKQAQKPPKVVIQASGAGYYGVHDYSVTITEDSPPGDDFLADVCKQWEASTAAVTDMGVRHVIIRTGVVLSEEGGALPRLALPFKLFVGGPLGSGKQPLPWIHMHDEVKAIRHLIMDRDASGPYNLTAPNPVTNREFGNKLGKVLGRPSFIPAPAFAFRLAFGEVATVVLDGQKAVPQRLEESGFEFTYTQPEAALREIYG
ncbi:MAG: TIGR01777 family oxidoreductase, partial [Phototrophicaceae bacterium]